MVIRALMIFQAFRDFDVGISSEERVIACQYLEGWHEFMNICQNWAEERTGVKEVPFRVLE
jgi:hypothetical protein